MQTRQLEDLTYLLDDTVFVVFLFIAFLLVVCGIPLIVWLWDQIVKKKLQGETK